MVIKHICNKETEIAEINTGVKYLVKTMDEIKEEVKQNSEFRIRAKGVIGVVAFIASLFGGLIVWAINKVWGKL